jgi:hypothetical protein
MRVLIYGSRTWTDPAPIKAFIDSLPEDAAIIHGAARGADSLAGELAQARGLVVYEFPADWKTHGRAAGPIRNRQMIEEGRPDMAVGFRMPGESSGTDNMTRQLAAHNIDTVLIRK